MSKKQPSIATLERRLKDADCDVRQARGTSE